MPFLMWIHSCARNCSRYADGSKAKTFIHTPQCSSLHVRRRSAQAARDRADSKTGRSSAARQPTEVAMAGVGKPKSADMHPGPGFRIRYEIERPPPEVVAGFGAFEIPDISDLMNRLYTLRDAIRPLTNPDLRIVGTACTVKV